MHPELLQVAEQGLKEQPSDVEKPHTPPKRETPLVPLQRYPTSSVFLSTIYPPYLAHCCHRAAVCRASCTQCFLDISLPAKGCSWLKV